MPGLRVPGPRVFVVLCVALAACSPRPDPDAAGAWRASAQAGSRAFRSRQYERAEGQFAEALRQAEAAGSEAGRLVALDGLAVTHAVRGDLGTADSLYTELLRLQERRFAADSLSGAALVRTLGSLGDINLNRGRLARADSYFSRILELGAAGAVDLLPEEGTLAYTLYGLGEVLAARGDSAGADSLRGRGTGLKLYAQGFGYYVGDDLVRAERAFRGALQQQERVLGPDHEDLARTAHALGRLYEFQGRRDEALRLYRRAARVYAAGHGDPLDRGQVLEDLAALTPGATADSLRRRAAELRGQGR